MGSAVAARVFVMSADAMDAVLMLGVEDAPELDSGIAAKLRAAATANPLALPMGKGAVKGRQFRVLAALARLSEIEMFALGSWLEDCYGEDHLARFEAELKTVTSRSTAHASAPVAAAPVSTSMGAGVSEAAVHSLSSEFEMLGRSPAPAGGADGAGGRELSTDEGAPGPPCEQTCARLEALVLRLEAVAR